MVHHCENCNCSLETVTAMIHHLETTHNIHVQQVNQGSVSQAYFCDDCQYSLGNTQEDENREDEQHDGHHQNSRKALEKHLYVKHSVNIHG